MRKPPEKVPHTIVIARGELFLPPIESGDQVWRRTTHAWARRNPISTLWLDAMCDGCTDDIWQEVTYAIGTNPHVLCEICKRQPTPYRRAPALEMT